MLSRIRTSVSLFNCNHRTSIIQFSIVFCLSIFIQSYLFSLYFPIFLTLQNFLYLFSSNSYSHYVFSLFPLLIYLHIFLSFSPLSTFSLFPLLATSFCSICSCLLFNFSARLINQTFILLTFRPCLPTPFRPSPTRFINGLRNGLDTPK